VDTFQSNEAGPKQKLLKNDRFAAKKGTGNWGEVIGYECMLLSMQLTGLTSMKFVIWGQSATSPICNPYPVRGWVENIVNFPCQFENGCGHR